MRVYIHVFVIYICIYSKSISRFPINQSVYLSMIHLLHTCHIHHTIFKFRTFIIFFYHIFMTYCNTLQHTATHCIRSSNTAHLLNITYSWHTKNMCITHAATHCNTLQHTATHCNTLQHTATHCNTLQYHISHHIFMTYQEHVHHTHQSNAHHAYLSSINTSITYSPFICQITVISISLYSRSYSTPRPPPCPSSTYKVSHTHIYLSLSIHHTLCNTLQYTSIHCNTLHHTASHCNTLQYSAVSCITENTASHCNPMQDTARHCNTLQDTVRYCNTLQHTAATEASKSTGGSNHRVAKTHRIPYLYRSFSAKEPYI